MALERLLPAEPLGLAPSLMAGGGGAGAAIAPPDPDPDPDPDPGPIANPKELTGLKWLRFMVVELRDGLDCDCDCWLRPEVPLADEPEPETELLPELAT